MLPSLPAAPHQPPLPSPDTQRLFSHESSSFQMFSSEAYGQKNLLFKDSTSELVPIATQTYEAWLGREYLHAMKGLLCDPNRKSTRLSSHGLWASLGTGTAVLCGEAAGKGHSPQELCPSASMRTDDFHLPASGGVGRQLSQSCLACCTLDAPSAPRGGIQTIRVCLGKRLLAPPHRSHQVPACSLRASSSPPHSQGPGSGVVCWLDHCSGLQMGFLLPAPYSRDMVCHPVRRTTAMIGLKPPHSPVKEAQLSPFCERKQDQRVK